MSPFRRNFDADVEYAANPQVWRLIVWNVSPEHTGLMARLRMIRAKNKPATFWREYPYQKREQVLAAIALLTEAGLHGIARRAEKTPLPKFKRKPTLVKGFGGALNAQPIAGTWRRKTRHK
jgi:hypothetical protein